MKIIDVVGRIDNDQRVCVMDHEEKAIFEGKAFELSKITKGDITRIDAIAHDEAMTLGDGVRGSFIIRNLEM